MIRADYHTHTCYCDGDNTPREMVGRAVELGLEYYGFSSHCFTWMKNPILTNVPEYIKDCKRVREEFKDRITILIGMEQENLLGGTVYSDIEYSIGSTHYIFDKGEFLCLDNSSEEFEMNCLTHFEGDYYKYIRAYYETEAEVVKNTSCTFIGHFDLITKYNEGGRFFDESDKRYTGSALEALEYLSKSGVPFELNTSQYVKKRKREMYPSMFLLKKMHELKCEIILSSDSHKKEMIGTGFGEAAEMAKECGFDHVNILTEKGFRQIEI